MRVPLARLPLPPEQVFDIASVADADNRLIVGGKLKAISMVRKDL
jgi:hypothetical protein